MFKPKNRTRLFCHGKIFLLREFRISSTCGFVWFCYDDHLCARGRLVFMVSIMHNNSEERVYIWFIKYKPYYKNHIIMAIILDSNVPIVFKWLQTLCSVFYAISVCIGVFICTRYAELKKHHGTNQSQTSTVPTNQVTTIQMTNPQTVQTMMVNGQLMQVVTPTNQITTQPTVVTTGNITASQPQMMIVQNPNTQQVVQQAVVQPTTTIVGQNDLPPSYQVLF